MLPSQKYASSSLPLPSHDDNDGVVILKSKISKCLTEIKLSKNSITRKNSLKRIKSFIQQLTEHPGDQQKEYRLLLIQILQGTQYSPPRSSYEGEEQEDSIPSLTFLLLEIISDEESTEICRERSAVCLQECLKSLLSILSYHDDIFHSSLRIEFIHDFYVKYCSLVHSRFGFNQNNNCGGNPSSYEEDGNRMAKSYEDAEEIRLILIQIMSDVLFLMEHHYLSKEIKPQNNDNSYQVENHHNKKELISKTALVCQVIAKSTCIDPYPELKRESCKLVTCLTRAFPNVIVMNEEMILNSIIGCSQMASRLTASTSLIQHRHAKTRSVALEAVVDIMYCHNNTHVNSMILMDGEGGEEQTNEDRCIETTRKSSLEERLMLQIIPNLESTLPFDRSASVRCKFITVVGKLLHLVLCQTNSSSGEHLSDLSPSSARLVVLLLMGISDEVDVVRKEGLSRLNQCAKLAAQYLSIGNKTTDGIHQPLTANFNTETTTENDCSNVVSYFLETIGYDVISILLERILNKTSVESIKRYLEALYCTVESLSHYPNKNDLTLWTDDLMVRIVSTLCNSFLENEEDDSIFQATITCAKGFGLARQTRTSAFELVKMAFDCGNCDVESNGDELQHFDRVDISIDSSPKMLISSNDQCASAVNFIGGLINGWHVTYSHGKGNTTAQQLDEGVRKISALLTTRKVLESVHSSSGTSLALLSTCHTLIHFISDTNTNTDTNQWCEKSNVIVRNITWCCIHLLGCPKDFNVAEPSMKLLQSFSIPIHGIDSYIELLESNFKFMLKKITDEFDTKTWVTGDQDLLVFDALIRTSGGQTVGENFDLIMPIFEKCLAGDTIGSRNNKKQSKEQITTNLSTKLFLMALVESIVSDDSLPKYFIHPFIEKLLHVAVIPNLVWQVGGMASALRKVSAVVLFSIIQGDCTTDMVIFKISSHLLPLLKSNLSDDDSSLRELTISSMCIVFKKLPGTLGEEAIHQLYPELMKCFDDSNRNVRNIACDAVKAFLKCAPVSHYHGTAITYMIEYLFIHLDDPDPCFREKVYLVLIAALDIDASQVIKGAETSLLSHSSRHYCDLLLRTASEKKKLENIL